MNGNGVDFYRGFVNTTRNLNESTMTMKIGPIKEIFRLKITRVTISIEIKLNLMNLTMLRLEIKKFKSKMLIYQKG